MQRSSSPTVDRILRSGALVRAADLAEALPARLVVAALGTPAQKLLERDVLLEH